jgi:hypothetical protein
MATRKDGISSITQRLHLFTGEWFGMVLEIFWNTFIDIGEHTLPDALIKPVC